MRAFWFAALALAVGVLTTGCSSSADLSGVAKAANNTQDAKTSRFWMSFEPTDDDSGQMEGGIDFENNRGFMNTKAGSLIFETIWIGSTFYVKSPEMGSTKKPWLRLDDEGIPALSQFGLLQPDRLFGLVKTAGSFKEAGMDSVRSVSTTRFDGTVETKKFFEAMYPATPDEEPDDLPDGSLQVSVWVDANEYVRRIAFDAPTIGDDAGGRVTIEFYAIGEPIDVAAPPSDQVGAIDLPSDTGGLTYTDTLDSSGFDQTGGTVTLEPTTGG